MSADAADLHRPPEQSGYVRRGLHTSQQVRACKELPADTEVRLFWITQKQGDCVGLLSVACIPCQVRGEGAQQECQRTLRE